ncbi:MAG TPA: STELLO glycosyltransferase family protein [Pyrinomonadaceae bacterium]|nr:STELLO glycosyltransferase family protein [Pyrinomonadaceae bacterium]
MKDKIALVVTSIAPPNAALKALAGGCREQGFDFFVIGDEASPPVFELEGCRFYGMAEQRSLPLRFALKCPTRHYARKNIGYLVAMRESATVIIETDDDNIPVQKFWEERTRRQLVRLVSDAGWVNVYRYFTDANIWPRGLPLDKIQSATLALESLSQEEVDCPIQQGLADENPDVDAIYRLALPLPQSFRKNVSVALGNGSWSPFNSQNTTWWRDAFPLLYLPAYCSFRMTDIWRSFVAQRIAWANDWGILFHEPTVWQERNEHNLMRDFKDEVPGYLNNSAICEALGKLSIQPGREQLTNNLRLCYEELIRMGLVGGQELDLVEAWIADLEELSVIREKGRRE